MRLIPTVGTVICFTWTWVAAAQSSFPTLVDNESENRTSKKNTHSEERQTTPDVKRTKPDSSNPATQEKKSKPEVGTPPSVKKQSFYATINPYSSIWSSIPLLTGHSLVSQEIGFGYQATSKWGLEISYLNGKSKGSEPVLTESKTPDGKAEVFSSPPKEWVANQSQSGRSLSIFYTVIDNSKSRFRLGLGVNRHSLQTKKISEIRTTGSVLSDPALSSISTVTQENKSDANFQSLIFSYDYHVDSFLSVGIRYSINSGKIKTSSHEKLNSRIANALNSQPEESKKIENKEKQEFTRLNGIHLTIHF